MSLGEQLSKLEMERAAFQALVGYCQAIDENDLGKIREVFDPSAVLVTATGTRDGIDDIVEMFEGAFSRRDFARHSLANFVTKQSSDEIRAECYFNFIIVAGDKSEKGAGSYKAVFKETAGALKIASLEIKVHFREFGTCQ